MHDQLSGSGPKSEIKNFQIRFMGKNPKNPISGPGVPNIGPKKNSDLSSEAKFNYLSDGILILGVWTKTNPAGAREGWKTCFFDISTY